MIDTANKAVLSIEANFSINFINKPFKYNNEWIICRLDEYKESKLDNTTLMNLKKLEANPLILFLLIYLLHYLDQCGLD